MHVLSVHLWSIACLSGALLLAWIVSLQIIRRTRSRLLPGFLVFMAVGFVVRTLAEAGLGEEAMGRIAAHPLLAALQSSGLFLLVTPSCTGLRLAGLGSRALEVFGLVLGALLAFVMALLVVPMVHLIAPDPDFRDASGHILQAHFLALSLGAMVTSLPFLTKIMIDAGLLRTTFAQNLLLAACIVDILVWIIFSLTVTLLADGRTEFGMAALYFFKSVCAILSLSAAGFGFGVALSAIGRGAGFAATGSGAGRRDMPVILFVSAFVIWVSTIVGLKAVVGMVAAGLVIGLLRERAVLRTESFEALSDRIGSPLYFILVGFGLNLDAQMDLYAILAFVVWTSLVKIGAVAFVMGVLRMRAAQSLDFGIAMNTRGGPGLVLAAASYSTGLIGLTGFAAMTLASIATAIFTDIYLKRAQPRIAVDERAAARSTPIPARPVPDRSVQARRP